MVQLTATRFAALALTCGLVVVTGRLGAFTAVTFSIAFGHYLLSYVYSRGQIRGAMSTWRSGTTLVALLALGVALFAAGVNIVWTFALHHAINESFMLDRYTAAARTMVVRVVRGAGFLFHLAVYAMLMRRDVQASFSTEAVVGFLAVSTVFYGGVLLAARRNFSRAELVGHTAVELTALALLAVVFGSKIGVVHVACYHFMVWAIFPATQMASARRYRRLATYVSATLVATAACLLVSPLRLTPWVLSTHVFAAFFMLQSQVHVTTSFVLSRTNPLWVSRWAEGLQRPGRLGAASA